MKKILALLALAIFYATLAIANEEPIKLAKVDKNVNLKAVDSDVSPIVTEKYQYYEIRGNEENQLRRQMSQNGTKWNDGKTYDALTTWDISWDYQYDARDNMVYVDGFRTTVDIVFRYPKWVKTEEAPTDLVGKWDHYMKNLIEHENGHRDLAVTLAKEVNEAIAQLGPARSKKELDRVIKDTARAKMAELKTIQVAYDDDTGHGRTQGAVFP